MTQLAAICLLLLHVPTGHPVHVNAKSIVTLRSPGSGGSTSQHLSVQTGCMVSTGDGKFVAVKQTCEEVRQQTARCPSGATPS